MTISYNRKKNQTTLQKGETYIDNKKKEGTYSSNGTRYNVVDLPGIYSLSAHSEDDKAARDYILSGEADLIGNIVDVVNLEINLYLTMMR